MSQRDNFIKGRISETIVKELFIELGYEVYHFGREYTVPALKDELNKMDDPVSLMVRKMPDLLLVDKKKRKSFFVEVKYRKDGVYPNEKDKKKKDLENNPYDEALIVLLSTTYIQCKSVEECKKKPFGPHHIILLSACETFGFDKKNIATIRKFIEHLRYFKIVDNKSAKKK